MRLSSRDSLDPAAVSAVQVVLFRCMDGLPRGWFIAPLVLKDQTFDVPFLPMERNTHAALAVVRALEVAQLHGLEIRIVDPDDLWDEVWC